MPKVRITLDKPSHNMQQFQLQQNIHNKITNITTTKNTNIKTAISITNKSSHKTVERAV